MFMRRSLFGVRWPCHRFPSAVAVVVAVTVKNRGKRWLYPGTKGHKGGSDCLRLLEKPNGQRQKENAGAQSGSAREPGNGKRKSGGMATALQRFCES